MSQGTFGQVFARILALVGGMLFALVLFRVITAILRSVMPGTVVSALAAGAQMLLGYVTPALPAVAALALLYGLWWIVTGRR